MNDIFGYLSEDWNDVDEVAIFGAGNIFRTYFYELLQRVKIRFVIDNSPNLAGKKYQGIPVFSLTNALQQLNGTKIVIMAETTTQGELRQALIDHFLVENKDFTNLERFVCEWGYKHLHRTELLEVHTAITTSCTFRCKKCNMFIPYHAASKKYSLTDLKYSIDLLFQYIDSIFKYQIVGGEPFLNEDLAGFIHYVHTTYNKRISHLRIITNGSVLPDKVLLETLKSTNCEVYLSDYRNAIKYNTTFEKVLQSLKEMGINYVVIPSMRWRDAGFPERPCSFNPDDVKGHMIECGTSWHGLIEGRLYYCNVAWSAEKCGLFSNQDDDYLDLKTLPKNHKSKENILSLCLGDYGKKYNSFCCVCAGCGKDNKNFVRIGEQCTNG